MKNGRFAESAHIFLTAWGVAQTVLLPEPPQDFLSPPKISRSPLVSRCKQESVDMRTPCPPRDSGLSFTELPNPSVNFSLLKTNN
jgi:hypothetical protein